MRWAIFVEVREIRKWRWTLAVHNFILSQRSIIKSTKYITNYIHIIIVHLKPLLPIVYGLMTNYTNRSKNIYEINEVMAINLVQNTPLLDADCFLMSYTTAIIFCLSSGIVIDFEHFTLRGASQTYPSSTSTCLQGSNHVASKSQNMSRSLKSSLMRSTNLASITSQDWVTYLVAKV